ncbi:unnamed protein product [Knipowitschia caucasica]
MGRPTLSPCLSPCSSSLPACVQLLQLSCPMLTRSGPRQEFRENFGANSAGHSQHQEEATEDPKDTSVPEQI